MKAKPVIPRQSVSGDIDEALAHYLDEGATGAALGFIDAVEHAFTCPISLREIVAYTLF